MKSKAPCDPLFPHLNVLSCVEQTLNASFHSVRLKISDMDQGKKKKKYRKRNKRNIK
jgi:hypothetical protein